MAQVSRRKLSKETEEKIFHTFWEAISKLNTKPEIKLFLNDILSPTEKIMIAKRLAIATLLNKGYSYQDIKDILKVSQETIAKVSLTLSLSNGYQNTINKIARSQAIANFWQRIERVGARTLSLQDYKASEDLLKRKLNHKNKILV